MAMVIFAVETSQSTGAISFSDETKNYCPICVKKYLQEMYYVFGHINFKKKISFLIFCVLTLLNLLIFKFLF